MRATRTKHQWKKQLVEIEIGEITTNTCIIQ